MDDVLRGLGTVLMVWAHPDDETYLAGGLSAALSDAGQRVVCVTATRGEAGGTASDLAQVRTAELEAALEMLGVADHHWLDYPDGGCETQDADGAAERIRAIVDEVRPDAVLTFGSDGYTGHPDHRTVSGWVDLAVADTSARVLHAVSRKDRPDPRLDDDFGVFELGRPRTCADEEIDVLFPLGQVLLDRKVSALLMQESQTAGLVSAVGMDRFRAWVAVEAFARPAAPR